MGLAEAANLVINLKLNDQASKALMGVQAKVKTLGGSFSKIGPLAKQGLSTAVSNLAKLGAAAGAAGLAIGAMALKSGLDSLATLEDSMSAVQGAIEATGNTGKITAKQIAGWANEIESNVGAAFDDKDILASAETLLRYGKVVPQNVKPALQVMTDLATKTGSVESAAALLAKAMADPTNAAGKLARAGVILTDQQKDQIDAMTKAGDVAGAQTVLLDALTTATQGAAAASQGPYRRAISTLKDTWEDVTRALAVGFLPILTKVSEYLKGKLADPGFLDKVQAFGQSLADGLGKAFEAAKNIPWDSIGSAMKLAGEGAKAAYNLFMGLPDWVKTAVITGWGLNKLTGGALGGIVGELGKGLIKGVLGMNAAVVNINAGVVNGAGGIPGAAGGAAGGGAVGTIVGGAAVGVLVGGTIASLNEIQNIANDNDTLMKKYGLTADELNAYLAEQRRKSIAAGGAPGRFAYTHANMNTTTQAANLASALTKMGPLPVVVKNGATGGQTTPNAPNSFTGQMGNYIAPVTEGLSALNTTLDGVNNTFVSMLGQAVTELRGLGEKGDKLRRDLAERLGLSVGELVNLRHAVTGDMASQLGLTVGELRAIKRQAGYDDEKIAAKLGISVGELQAIREKARQTAANTLGIKNKNWSPKIIVNNTIKANTYISGREIQRAVTHQQLVSGGKTVE